MSTHVCVYDISRDGADEMACRRDGVEVKCVNVCVLIQTRMFDGFMSKCPTLLI